MRIQTMKSQPQTAVAAVWLSLASLFLAGCSGFTSTAPVTVPGVALRGTVHGGQQPISNATLQLYAAGSTGYGSAYSYSSGTSLLGTHVVTTNANGGFSITGDYTCPSSTTEVYLVATDCAQQHQYRADGGAGAVRPAERLDHRVDQ
jgi:hypothetical protein